MFIKKIDVSEYMTNNFEREEENNMALAEAIYEAIEIWKQEGRAEGREEGRKAGRREGQQEAKVSTIIRLLSKKLNASPTPEIISKLEKLDLKQLETIEDRIFEIESWGEV